MMEITDYVVREWYVELQCQKILRLHSKRMVCRVRWSMKMLCRVIMSEMNQIML